MAQDEVPCFLNDVEEGEDGAGTGGLVCAFEEFCETGAEGDRGGSSGVDVYGMDDGTFADVFGVETGVVDVCIVVSGGETWVST